MTSDKMGASSANPGIGVFCHIRLTRPNPHESDGFYALIGVRTASEAIAVEKAKSFLSGGFVQDIEIEELSVLSEGELPGVEDVQKIGGYAFYGEDDGSD